MIKFIIEYFVRIRIIRNTHKLSSIGKNPFFGKNGVILGGNYISIGNNFSVGDDFKLQAWNTLNVTSENPPSIRIGDSVSLMSNCQISCCNKIIIGDGCLFGDNVFVTDNYHGKSTLSELGVPPILRDLYSKGPVVIGKNVWSGRNVCIMPGVTIADGAVIGANAVVTHDIPAYSVAVGVPAKSIKRIEKNS